MGCTCHDQRNRRNAKRYGRRAVLDSACNGDGSSCATTTFSTDATFLCSSDAKTHARQDYSQSTFEKLCGANRPFMVCDQPRTVIASSEASAETSRGFHEHLRQPYRSFFNAFDDATLRRSASVPACRRANICGTLFLVDYEKPRSFCSDPSSQ